ncbi:hypothetical protein N431DRAFT_358055 [Stipitochalara longipes BDJ]|nr:hypothetical protein N431DRAFT_358055 [Stipitochalara longipes BDJ]
MGLYIRTIIRSNSRSIPDRGPIHIRCQARWEILDFCEKELQGYSDLMSLLTLTGTPTSAQADSCEDYVRETWGPAGLELLNRFILGLKTKSCDAFLAEGRYVHIDFHPKNQEHPEMASIHLTGNLDQIIEILEQLSWFAVTFRTSSKGQLTMSHAIFQERPGKLKFEKGEPEFELSLVTPRHHSISVNPNDNLEQSNCWLPLFSSGILAQGFPIRQRPEAALGLDLAFPVLAQLARLDGPMSYAEGIVFSGKLSIIFPTRLLDAGTRGVQWHFVGVDDPASIVDILEESEWFQSRDFEQLITSRAFLGYCRYSQVLAGTKESLERSQIGESCIQRSISRLEIRPEANISTTLTANGVWAATLKTKVVLSKGLRAQIGDDEIDFRDRVHRTVKSPVLVFDTATQSAWLIPEVSLILHMVHEYLKQDWVQTPRGPEVTLPYAQMSPDGGRAAFNAIVEHGHQELWERQEDGQAKRFMDEINMKKAAARRTLRHPRLLGWDFMDILSKEHLFFERELPEDMGPRMAWWELAINTDTLVIFGSNFGQLIRPHPEQTPVCKAWNPIPENFNLLIASARCIMYLAMKCNARDSSCRKVADGLEWHTPKGSYLYGHPCVKAGCETCMFIQELRAPQKKPWQRHEKNLAGGESIEPDGALIFGSVDHYHKLLKRRRQTLVNRTMPPSPAGPSNTPFGANTQSSPVASNIPVSGAATIRAFSISNLGAQQPRANSASTEIAFQNSPLSSSLGKSTVNQPALHLRDEQSRPSDQIQAA